VKGTGISTSAMSKTRLLLLGDHLLFRECLRRLLASERDFELVAECATSAEALQALDRYTVDIVLLDYDSDGEHGFEFIRKARNARYTGRMFLLTAGMSDGDAVRALGLGVCAIFLKSRPPKHLTETIRKVMTGETCIDESCIRALIQAVDRSAKREQARTLTYREHLVLNGVSEGLTNKEIAAALDMSEGSVKSTLQHIFIKTRVHRRSQLVRLALEQKGGPVGTEGRT
jgi:DNA-binding NarL/FixJ family response regulator